MHRAGLVLPPVWAMALVAFLYVAAAIPFWLLKWSFGQSDLTLLAPQQCILWFSTATYAGYRLLGFHPAVRVDYRRWLQTTPWRHPDDLPMGPIHFEWPDLLILLTLCLASQQPEITAAVFLIAYLFVSVFVFAVCEQRWAAYVTLLVLSGIVWLAAWNLPAALLMSLAAYVLAQGFHQATLRRFPWPGLEAQMERWLSRGKHQVSPKLTADYIGWPFCELHGQHQELNFPIGQRIAAVLISASWLHTLLAFCPTSRDAAEMGGILITLSAVAISGARISLYLVGRAPSLNFLARLRRGGVLPGFDKIFVAPIAMILAAWLLPRLVTGLQIDPSYGMPLALAVVLSIGFFVGPRLHTWRLTGDHRFVASTMKRSEMEQI